MVPGFRDRISKFFKGKKRGSCVKSIPHNRVKDCGEDLVKEVVGEDEKKELIPKRIMDGDHYFKVELNQMYLAKDSRWLVTFTPMILASIEFQYGSPDGPENREIPFTVGPDSLGAPFGKARFSKATYDTLPMTELYPYRGETLEIAMGLLEVPYNKKTKNYLKMFESTAGILNLIPGLDLVSKMVHILLDGWKAFVEQVKPEGLMYFKKGFSPRNGFLEPGYWAAIGKPAQQLKNIEFGVRDNKLVQGKDLDEATDYQDADFILFSIRPREIKPVKGLEIATNIDKDFEHIKEIAGRGPSGDVATAIALLAKLYQKLVRSPRITIPHAEHLREKYMKDIQTIIKGGEAIRNMSEDDLKLSDFEKLVRKGTFEILRMG